MSSIDVPLERGRFGQTARRDFWWVQPLLTFLGLGAFIVYSTWAAFQGDHYRFGPYLSPLYSPEIFGQPGDDSWFGQLPAWMPCFVTGAMLILWAPGGFRFTCYYYRGAYYKAFWADPPSCTVGEPRKKYLGERYFPLIIQNIHRYFLYLALIFLVLLAHDVWKATLVRQRLRHRRGHAGAARQRHSAGRLHARLPFAAPLGRRHVRSSLAASRSQDAYDCVSCLNRAPHAVGLDAVCSGSASPICT